MYGQSIAANKLLSNAYRGILRRMWLKNATFTVALGASVLLAPLANAETNVDGGLRKAPPGDTATGKTSTTTKTPGSAHTGVTAKVPGGDVTSPQSPVVGKSLIINSDGETDPTGDIPESECIGEKTEDASWSNFFSIFQRAWNGMTRSLDAPELENAGEQMGRQAGGLDLLTEAGRQAQEAGNNPAVNPSTGFDAPWTSAFSDNSTPKAGAPSRSMESPTVFSARPVTIILSQPLSVNPVTPVSGDKKKRSLSDKEKEDLARNNPSTLSALTNGWATNPTAQSGETPQAMAATATNTPGSIYLGGIPAAMPSGVFATPYSSAVDRRMTTARTLLIYCHGLGTADMYTASANGQYGATTRYDYMNKMANEQRQWLAINSGGLMDSLYTLLDSGEIGYKTGDTPWGNPFEVINPILAAKGLKRSDYDFVQLVWNDMMSSPYALHLNGAAGIANGSDLWADHGAQHHETGHNLGFGHANNVDNTSSGASLYTYDFGTKQYVTTPSTSNGTGVQMQPLTIGLIRNDYGNPTDLMGGGGDKNQYNPRDKQKAGWFTSKHFATLTPGTNGQASNIAIHNPTELVAVTDGNVLPGQEGLTGRYGVEKGYSDVPYSATFVRKAQKFVANADGTGGKWVTYTQVIDLNHVKTSGTNVGIEFRMDGAYYGILQLGQKISEKDFAQLTYVLSASPWSTTNYLDLLNDLHAAAPDNPNRYRSTWFDLEYTGNGTDAAGNYANLLVTTHIGSTPVGHRWNGGSTWDTTSTNWVNLDNGNAATTWVDGKDATFGTDTAPAGTVTVNGTVSAASLTFKPTSGGDFTLTGGTISLGAGGLNAEASATIESNLNFTDQQVWEILANKTVAITGTITDNGNALQKIGLGTLALNSSQTLADIDVYQGLVRQTADQTITNLNLFGYGDYRVDGGTLSVANGASFTSEKGFPGALILNRTDSSGASPELRFIGGTNIGINVLLGGGQHVIQTNTNGPTISGAIGGTGGITLHSSSTNIGSRLTLSGNNTFTGDIEIQRGSLHLIGLNALKGNNVLRFNVAAAETGAFYLRGLDRSVKDLSSTGAGTAIIANAQGARTDGTSAAATLRITQNNAGTFAGKIVNTANDTGGSGVAGALGVEKLGAATLTLTGANTYTGLTTISAGTLQIGNNGTTGTLGSGAVIDNAALVFNRSDAAGYTVSNAISGTGTLTQNGTGALIQTGADTRTGATFVNAGVLRAGAANVFSSGSGYTLANASAAALDLAGYNQSVGSLAGGGATGGNVTLGAATLTLGVNNANTAYAGVISGTGSLVKTGSGIQSLSGQNTYTGGTTVNGGVLRLDFASVTTDILSPASALTLGGGTLELQGKSGAANAQTFTGVTLLANTRSTLKINANGANTADMRLGNMSVGTGATVDFVGGSGFTTTGGRFSLKGVTGAYTVTGVDLSTAGKRLGAFATWNGTDWAASSGVSDGFGGYYLQAFTGYADVWNGTASGTTAITNGPTTDVRIRQASGGYENNTLAAGTVTINSLMMSAGGNAATVDMTGKTLVVGDGANGSGGIAVAAGAKSLTLGTASDAGTLTSGTSGTSNLTLSSNNASATDGLVVNAKIVNGGTGVTGLVVSGGTNGGTVVLTGTNTFGGGVKVVSGGKLRIGDGGDFGTLGSGAVSLDAGTSLAFNRRNTLAVANAISGSGDLIQAGSGTTVLTGANTYAGTTTITAGTLQVGAGGVSGSLGSGAVVDNGALVFNRSDAITVANAISGTGTLTQSGSNTLTLTGANTYAGGTSISSGTLQVGDGSGLGTGAVSGTGQLLYNRSEATVSVANAIGGGVSLAHNGTGTLVLTGANTHTGTTTIASGKLQIGAGGTAGSLGSGAVTNNGILSFNRSDALTVGNAISGTGSLYQDGAGTTILTGTNTYAGTTAINLGTLQVGDGGTTGTLGSGEVLVNGTLSFNRSNTVTMSNIVTGLGDITQNGTGTLVLTGDGTRYSGNLIANSGVIQIGDGGTTGNFFGATLVTNSTIAFKRSDLVDARWAITGTGGITQNGTGTLLLAGANTFTGNVAVNSGILRLGNSKALGAENTAASKGNVASGATLDLNGFATGANGITIAGTGTNGQGALTNSGASTDSHSNQMPTLALSADASVGGTGDFGLNMGYWHDGATTLDLAGHTLTKSGTNTFYIGDTLVTAGNIRIATGTLSVLNTSDASAAGISLDNTAGTSLALNNNNFSAGALSGGGATGGGVALGSGRLTVGALGTSTAYAGAITGTGGLTKVGAGTLTLSGQNTYTGSTNVNGGTLRAGAVNTFGTNSAVTLNGAGVSLDLNGHNQTIGSLAGASGTAGTVILGSATLTTGANESGDTTYAGIISGIGGSLTKVGDKAMTLTGINTYTGATTVAAGTLTLDLTTGSLASSTLVMNGGTMVFKGKNGATSTQSFVNTTIGAGASTITLNRNSATLLEVNLGSITNSSGGTINFTGITGTAGAATGAQFITTSGTNGALLDGGAQWAMVNGADWAAISTVGGKNYIVAYTGFTGVTTQGTEFIPDTAAADVKIINFAGTGETGAIGLTGSSVTSINSLLMSANDIDATVNTAGKTLIVGQFDAGSIAVAVGAKSLTLGNAENDGFITVDTTAAAKKLTLISNNSSAAQGLVINSRIQDNASGGVVSLIVSGGASAGTVVLAGDNTYTGTTTVTNSGTLQIGNGGTHGSLAANSGAISLGNATKLVFNRAAASTLTLNNAISGDGNLVQSGAGTTILTGTIAHAGTTTINSGTLQIGNGGATAFTATGNITDNGALVFKSASDITLTGTLSGAGTLTQSGPGALILAQNNGSFTGVVSITGGTLRLGNGGNTGSIGTYAGAIANSGTLAINRSGNYTFANVITGTGGFTQEGTGTTTLTGANNYTGTTTISAGTLQIGNADTTGALGSGNIVNNGTLTINRTDAVTIASVISGTGNLNKQSTGTLTLSGANTASGTTFLANGVLRLTHSLALQNSTLNFTGGPLVFDSSVASHAFTLGGLSGNRDLTLADNAGAPNAIALSIGANNRDTSFTGKILGAGSLIKIGTGTLSLGGSNTFTGDTTISAGTLAISGGSDDIALTGKVHNNAALTFIRGVDTNLLIASVIDGTGTITQSGKGGSTISGNNTYTGKTYITAGTLSLGHANALGAGGVGGETYVDGGTLNLNGMALATERIFIAGTGKGASGAIVNNTTDQINAITNLTLTADAMIGGGRRFDLRSSNVADKLDLAGYTLTKVGSNEFRIAGATVTNGDIIVNSGTVSLEGTTLLQGAGTVTVNTGGTLGFFGTTGANVTRAIVVNTGGILKNLGDATTPDAAINSAINLAGDTAIFDGGSAGRTQTYNGVISGAGDLTVQGSGTTILTANNTYTGATTIAAGTLQIGNGGTSGTLGSGEIIANGNLAFKRSDTVTYDGVISGTGGVTQAGTGTLVLSGANLHTGITSANAGTLKLSDELALQSSTLNMNGGAVAFDSSVTSHAFTLGGLSGSGNLTLADNAGAPNAVALTVGSNNTNTNHSGVISGAGSLTKIGTGTLRLFGANTYTGKTFVNAGILQLDSAAAAANALGAGGVGAETIVNSGGTLDLYGAKVDSTEIIRIAGTGAGGIGALVNNHWGTGAIINNLTLTDDASVGGDRRFDIQAGTGTNPTLDLANHTLTKVGANQFNVKNGAVTDGDIIVNGGTFSVEGTTTLQGAGTVTVNNGGAFGIYATGTGAGITRDIVVNTGGTVINMGSSGAINSTINLAGTTATFDSANQTQTYNGVISGGADLTVQGTGTTVFTAANTYSGKTIVSAGTLRIDNGGSLGTGTVTNNAALNFNRTDSFAVANAISGTGTLTKNGAGVMTLSGTNTYTGATAVNTGTLNLTGSLASAINVASGATIAGAGSTSSTLTLAAGSNLLLSGGATTAGLTANGGVTFSGNIALNYTTAFVTGTEYTVLNSTGGFTGYTPGVITCVSRGFFTQTATKISFTAGLGALIDTWNVASGVWDTQTTASWSNGAEGKFYTGDTVKFTDTVGGTAATVTLNSTVLPAAVIIDNSTVSYTLSGTGKISGASSLTKNGTGVFALNTANDYTGDTTINAGTLQIGNRAALGNGLVTVNNGGTLDLNGQDVSNPANTKATITLVGGTLTSSSTSSDAYLGAMTLNGGGTILTNSARWIRLNGDISGTGDLIITGTGTASANKAVTLSNSGNIILNGGSLNTNNNTITFANGGGVVVNAGTLSINNAAGTTITSLSGTGGTVSLSNALTINQTVDGTYAGRLTGSGLLTKSGSGTLTLTGTNNNNSGGITISAGILRLGNGDTSGGLGSGAITANGTLLLDRSDALTLANAISGNGAIVKNGASAFTLNNANAFTGAITINGGAFSYAGSLAATAVTLNNGASTNVASGTSVAGLVTVNTGSTLSGTGTVGGLTLATGSRLLATTTGGALSVNGAVTVANGALIDFDNALTAGNTYRVLNYTGAFNGLASDFRLGVRGTVSVSGGHVDVLATSGLALRWTGTSSGAWGVNDDANNFARQSDGTPDDFYQRDSVLMDDTATRTTATTASALTLTDLTFDNTSKAYTLDGAGSLAVTGTLTKSGTNTARINLPVTLSAVTVNGGTLTLASPSALTLAGATTLNGGTLDIATTTTATLSGNVTGAGSLRFSGTGTSTLSGTNNYTGATQVSSGKLVLGSIGALGATSGVTVDSGASLDLNGKTLGTGLSVVASGSGVSGIGAITNSVGTKAILGKLTLAGDLTFNNTNAILLGSMTDASGSLDLAGHTLTKTGAGKLILNGLSMTGAGDIIVNEGTLQLFDDYGSGTQKDTTLTGTGTLTINSGGTLNTSRFAGTLNMTMAIVLNGGTLRSSFPGPNGMTIASNIRVDADSTLNFNSGNSGNVTLSGNISGTGALAINGDTFTRTLTGDNSAYSGVITLNAGTLQIGNNGTTGTLGSGAVVNNTAIVFKRSDALTVANAISGTGTVTQAGTGTLTLSGASTYTGATAVNTGTLNLTGTLTSAINVASGASITGTGSTTGTLTFADGAKLLLAGGATTGGLTATGGVTFSGNITWSFANTPTTGGVYTLVDAGSGTITGYTAGVTLTTGGYRGTLNKTASKITFTSGGVLTDTWNSASGVWDTQSTTAWSNGSDSKFYTGDTVKFTDAIGGTVTLNSTVLPAAVIVDNTTVNYTISGTGKISGTSTITKTGTGTFTLSTANDFTGTTTVSAGTLKLGNANALGAGGVGSETFVQSGGTLDLNGTTVNSTERFNIAGTGVGGLGALINSTGSSIINSLRLTADATVGGTNRFDVQTGTSPTLDLAGHTLTKTGTNQFNVKNGTVTDGDIAINAGTFSVEGTTTMQGSGTVTVNNGGTLGFYNTGTGANITRSVVVNTGATLKNQGSSGAINSAINLAGTTATFDNGGQTQTYNGVVSGGADLTVKGSGSNVFTGVNTYTGATSVTSGTLSLGGAGQLGSGSYAGAIALSSGTTFNHNSTANQTLSGVISGSGKLTKTNSGALKLSGINSFTGGTTISAGTLITANTAALGTGAGAVQVNTGGTLQIGDGVIDGVTLGAGATLAMASGSTLKLGDIDSQIAMSGAFTLTSGMNLDITGLGMGSGLSLGQSTQYTIIAGTAAGSTVGAWSASANLVGGNLANYSYTLAMNGNNAVFSVTAVPEPETYGLLGAAAFAAAALVRRRRKTA